MSDAGRVNDFLKLPRVENPGLFVFGTYETRAAHISVRLQACVRRRTIEMSKYSDPF